MAKTYTTTGSEPKPNKPAPVRRPAERPRRSYKLLACPDVECGGESITLYARTVKAGVFRRHQCTVCGRRFASEQRIIGVESAQEITIPGKTLAKALAEIGIHVDMSDLDGGQ